MRSFLVRFVTSLSCFAACSMTSPAQQHGTSLNGPTPCDNFSCMTDELCKFPAGLGPDDGGPVYGCIPVAAGCEVVDCSGSACSPCLQQMCNSGLTTTIVDVHGRMLTCQ